MDVWLGEATEPTALLDPPAANFHAVTNIDHDAKGQRTLIEYGNGAKTAYTYDEKTLRLVHLKTTRGGAVLQDLFYAYDPVGNITRIRDDAQQTTFFNNQVVLPHCDYSYDPIYRLIAAAGREHIGQAGQPETSWDDEFRINLPHPSDGQAMRNYTEQYVYDAVGNFEKLIHQAANGNWTRAYAYNEASLIEPGKQSNRLSSTTVGARTEPYTYDAHGNMTSMPHLTLMQWNYKDELSATARQAVNDAPPPNTVPETTFYVYDASGERVRKVRERQNGTRKQERIYLGGFEIYREFKSNGTDIKLERETLHAVDDKQRIALVETKTITNPDDESQIQLIRFQLSSHLGSACLELDDKANVISYEEYTPYGSTSYQSVDKSTKAAAKRYRYTGKERDEETGLYYHGARYYAPWLGRWVSCDPSGILRSPNLYEYVNSRPLVLIDKSGLSDEHWFNISLLDDLAEAVDANLNAEARNKASQKPKEDVNIPLAVAKEAVTSGYELATKAPIQVAVQAGKTWQNEFVAAVVTPNANEATAHGVKAVGAAVRFTAASILAYEAAAKEKAPPVPPSQMAPEPPTPPSSDSQNIDPTKPSTPPVAPQSDLASPSQSPATPPSVTPPTPQPPGRQEDLGPQKGEGRKVSDDPDTVLDNSDSKEGFRQGAIKGRPSTKNPQNEVDREWEGEKKPKQNRIHNTEKDQQQVREALRRRGRTERDE
jgi:RHS repeat-associated protein